MSSVVRKCVEKATGKEYACKIVEFNDDSQEERDSTLREILMLKLVGGHPNIIEIIASFETPNYAFIVMELCPNGELFDYLTKVVRLSGSIDFAIHWTYIYFVFEFEFLRKTYTSNNVKYIKRSKTFTFSSCCSS